MTPEDRQMREAITTAMEVGDYPRVIRLMHEFYGDHDRCDRVSKGQLIMHLAMMIRVAEDLCFRVLTRMAEDQNIAPRPEH